MQSSISYDHALDMPDAIFPVEAMAEPVIKTAANVVSSLADQKQFMPSRALKISRAMTGETELRLLAEQDGNGGVHFLLASFTIWPYKVQRHLLVRGKKKTPMNKQQALEAFEQRVALIYPPEKLRNEKLVPIHINLL